MKPGTSITSESYSNVLTCAMSLARTYMVSAAYNLAYKLCDTMEGLSFRIFPRHH